jgi:modification methylase
MLPAIARQAIAAYTQPGDLVLDPMCGIGTTLVEAAHLGRHAVGVEYEARWAELARANLTLPANQDAPGTGQVHTGDARQLLDLLGPALRGTASLVLTSPPYERSVHGQVTARTGQGVAKHDDRYSIDPANLAHRSHQTLLEALELILGGCRRLVRPGGMVVLTAHPWRRHGHLVDFPGQLTRAAEAAGLVPYERNVALLVGLRGDRLVPARRSSSWIGSAKPAPVVSRCGSSPTRTSSPSAAPQPPWVHGDHDRPVAPIGPSGGSSQAARPRPSESGGISAEERAKRRGTYRPNAATACYQ